MRLLLDTHTFLWLVDGDQRLSSTAAKLIADQHNELILSVASIWELAIKSSLGKIVLRDPLDVFVITWTNSYQIQVQAVLAKHAIAVATLPFHHSDPFDRLLIAQAMTENLTLLSSDRRLHDYGVQIMW